MTEPRKISNSLIDTADVIESYGMDITRSERHKPEQGWIAVAGVYERGALWTCAEVNQAGPLRRAVLDLAGIVDRLVDEGWTRRTRRTPL